MSGLRILEIGHFVAAPFCTRLLGDLGADIIKVEPPAGDPVRQWGSTLSDSSIWWSLHGRNKRSIAIDLKSPGAREIVLGLVASCDALIENFRPGQLTKLGLSPEALQEARPGLVVGRISGFGQDGPNRDMAAFGVIGEAVGGMRYLTNHAPGVTDLPPVRVGISIGDSIAGLYTAFGVMAALWERERSGGSPVQRTLDVALSEAVLSMTEGMIPEFGALGQIKQPTGGAIATAAPSNAYPTRDGSWILIAANSDPLFARLAVLIGRPDLAQDANYVGNQLRVRNAIELDRIISDWTINHSVSEIITILADGGIPHCKVYTAEDCANDVQFRYRGMIREVDDSRFGKALHTGIVPHIPEAPGSIRWPGPAIGQHSEEILRDLIGLDPATILKLRDEGVVSWPA